jgi:hypothetical protein
MASINEAFILPLSETQSIEKLDTVYEPLRGSYQTYKINEPFKFTKKNSELQFYQLKDQKKHRE